MERSGGVTVDMLDCIAAETARFDQKLNAAYTSVMTGAHQPPAKNLLRDAQRAWISYRDKACMAEGEITAPGGTLGGVARASCALEITAQRAAALGRVAAASENAGIEPSEPGPPTTAKSQAATQGRTQPNAPQYETVKNAALLVQPGVDNIGLKLGRLHSCLQNGRYPSDGDVPREVSFSAGRLPQSWRLRTVVNGAPFELDMTGNAEALFVDEVRAGPHVGRSFADKYGMIVQMMRPCPQRPRLDVRAQAECVRRWSDERRREAERQGRRYTGSNERPPCNEMAE